MPPTMQGTVRDNRGHPLADATVSDGLHSTRTDTRGRFELPGSGPFVWLSVPTGWACTQWWQRAGAAEPVAFVVDHDPQPLPLRFGHLSDLHLTWGRSAGASELDLLSQHGDGSSALADGPGIRRRLARQVAEADLRLIVVTGDVTDRGTVSELEAAADLLGGLGVPVRLLPGNHDHYGHLDEPSDRDVPAADDWMGSATVHRWETVLGPRWWSFGHSGLHFVALDWFSARTGIDGPVQVEWLVGDLALLPSGTPVVVLMHDQPDAGLMGELGRRAPHVRIVAVLSGHWHTARAVELDGVLHLATGAGLFGGLDWSAPQTRALTWDGGALTSDLGTTTAAIPAAAPAAAAALGRPSRADGQAPRWDIRPVPAHSCHLASHPDGVVVTTADQDSGAGTVALVDAATGATRWSWAAPHPVASSAAVDHGSGAIFVQTMIGAVAAVETDGHLRWVADSADPYRTRVVHPPVLTADGHVVTGGAGRIRCHAVDDGRLRWQREIGRCDTFLTYGTGLTTSEVVVLPLGGPRFGFVALYLGNGATRWADPPRTPGPRSSLAAGGSGDAIVVRVGPVVERLTLGDGASRWRTELPGPLSIAPPVVLGGTVVVVTGDAVVHRLDAGTGEVRSRQALGGPGGHGPYRCRGPAVAAAVTATAAEVHVVTTSGHWWRIDPDGAEPQLTGKFPSTVTGPPVIVPGGERIVVAGTDGRVVAFDVAGGSASS